MRRTSAIVCGFECVEWPERTTSSDSTPSMCALAYVTTPSLLVAAGPLPSTAMIEFAFTPGAIGIGASVRMSGLPGVIP